MTLQEEITRRRTFAVIAHPDAGKTTLTEKLLLFGGAIHVAGAVKSNKIKKGATSDFMEIERQRGISVATSVMGFEIPGLQDQHSRYPGPRGFRRGHLPHADGRRLGHHRHRRRQGRRGPDPQADGGLPHAPDPGDRLHQQARPPVQGSRSTCWTRWRRNCASAYVRWPSRSRTAPRSRAFTTSTRRTSRSSRRDERQTADASTVEIRDLASHRNSTSYIGETLRPPAARRRRTGRGRVRPFRPRRLPAGRTGPGLLRLGGQQFRREASCSECFIAHRPLAAPRADRNPASWSLPRRK